MAGGYQPKPGSAPSLPTTGSGVSDGLARLKVELASRNLRITGLEETLRDMREQLIRARDALGRGHDLETECSRHIGRAWHMLNDSGVA